MAKVKWFRAVVVGSVLAMTMIGPVGGVTSVADAETRPVLYLTFDDGPGPDTPRFLDLLASYDLRASFFVTGKAVATEPDLARRIVGEGHAIANHSWSHSRLTDLSASLRVLDEFVSTNRVIHHTTGVTAACYRPPYGATSATVHAQAVAAGLPNQEWTTGWSRSHRGLWDIDTNDWRLSRPGDPWTESDMRRELNRAGDGDTVLLHDGSGSRRRGLAVLTDWLAVNHDRFDFRSLPGCGGRLVEPPLDPASPQSWHRFQIARLYRAYFDRHPDDAGWEYWNRIHSQGHSLIDISHWFALSSEFNQDGILDNEEFVAFVYRSVLDREPDAGGFRYWADHLDGGLGRGDLVVYFSESEEYVSRTVEVMTGECHRPTVEESYRCWADSLPAYDW